MSKRARQNNEGTKKNRDGTAELAHDAEQLEREADQLERKADELDRRAEELDQRRKGESDRGREHSADITIVLDRSGSMDRMKDEAIESFNTFMAEQRGVEGDASVTLVQFDHEYELLFEGCPLPEVPDLTYDTFRPRGRTALLDAVGEAIVRTERRLDDARTQPELVVFVILTDGQENASVEYRQRRVFDMIRGRETRCGWRFVFLGANQDAIREGGRFGVRSDRAMAVGASKEEYRAANRIVAGKVARFRSSGKTCDLNFTAEERRQAKK